MSKLNQLSVVITCICLLMFARSPFAQVAAPTLSAGLTAVTGQRGNLDIELLSEIISEKQDEVKREILQRKILDVMDGQSFALQNYVYSSFHALLSYKDKKAIEKELLTQVSILSLHSGLAEAILHLSFRRTTPSPQLETALKNYIANNYAADEKINPAKITRLNTAQINACYDSLKSVLKHEPFMLLFSMDNRLDEIVAAQVGNNTNNPKKCRINEKLSFTAILLDVVFEVARKNTVLQSLGFVQLHPNLQPFYADMNQYLAQGPSNYGTLNELVSASMSLLVTYHTIFYDFIDDGDLTIRKLFEGRGGQPAVPADVIAAKIDEVEGYVDKVQTGMQTLLKDRSVSEETVRRLAEMLDVVREGFTDFKTRNGGTIDKFSLNDYYFVRQHVQPLVNELVVLGILGTSEVQTVDQLTQLMYNQFLGEVHGAIADPRSPIDALDTIEIREYGHLIGIITSLSRLDDVKSYEQIFSTLGQIGISSLGQTNARFLKDIVYYLEAYASIDRDKNLLNVEVESLLLKLLSLYENRASGDFQLYFGVGLNQTLDINQRSAAMPVFFSDSAMQDPLSSLSYASEKIGMKLKLINNKRIQAKQEYELGGIGKLVHSNNRHRNEQPIISDLYVFAYGSGLLYNVANLTTDKNFDSALVGAGIGIAFFNSLDLSIWRVSPMVSGNTFKQNWGDRQFIGFSFDIKLTEYLTALAKKREQRKIAEAHTN